MSIQKLPDKFLSPDGETSSEVMVKSKTWGLLKQDRNGVVRFVVWPIREIDGQEVAIDLDWNEVPGYSFHRFEEAVHLFAELLTHSVVAA
jgi:hypothetical protein